LTAAPTLESPVPPPPSPSPRRYLLFGVVAAVAVAALVVGLVVVFGRTGAAKPHGAASTAPTGSSPATAGYPAGPNLVPATGILFGAWVQPKGNFQQPDRIAAVDALESAIGRKLDIVNTYRRFEEPFPTESDQSFVAGGRTLMLSWVVNDTQEVNSGSIDAQLTNWADRMRDFNHPMLVRLRWEMDRPNLRAEVWSPEDYIEAWKHIQDIFRAEQVENVSWVWCPTAAGFDTDGDAPSFYPGDDRVDWLCANAYPSVAQPALRDVLLPFLQWAAQHPKPVLIGEYGVSRSLTPAQRAKLLSDDAKLFQADTQIRAVSYFDGDPDGNKAPLLWGIRDDDTAVAAFAAMARDPYFNPANQVLASPVPG